MIGKEKKVAEEEGKEGERRRRKEKREVRCFLLLKMKEGATGQEMKVTFGNCDIKETNSFLENVEIIPTFRDVSFRTSDLQNCEVIN
jgi:hypothetical protein